MIKEIGIGGPRYGWERNATRECEEVPWTSRGFLSISQGDGWAWKQISTFYWLPSYNSIALIKKLVAHANLNFEISSRVDLRGVPWTASWRVAGAWRESSWNRGGRHIGKERKCQSEKKWAKKTQEVGNSTLLFYATPNVARYQILSVNDRVITRYIWVTFGSWCALQSTHFYEWTYY